MVQQSCVQELAGCICQFLEAHFPSISRMLRQYDEGWAGLTGLQAATGVF
jgi:hypothetical protein